MAQSWHLSMNGSAGVTAWRGSRRFIAGTPHISSGQGPKTLFWRTPQALASRRALLSYRASHSWCSVHEEHPFLSVSEGLMTEVLAVYGYLQPVSEISRTPTVAKEFQIGLYDPAAADLEHFWDSCSAGFFRERL